MGEYKKIFQYAFKIAQYCCLCNIFYFWKLRSLELSREAFLGWQGSSSPLDQCKLFHTMYNDS